LAFPSPESDLLFPSIGGSGVIYWAYPANLDGDVYAMAAGEYHADYLIVVHPDNFLDNPEQKDWHTFMCHLRLMEVL
jgi:hypothetical protein